MSNHLKWRKGYTLTARVLSFPDGKLLSIFKFPRRQDIRPAADPRFFIVEHPFRREFFALKYGSIPFPNPSEGAVAVELATGHAIISDTSALDVFGNYHVAELKNGTSACTRETKASKLRFPSNDSNLLQRERRHRIAHLGFHLAVPAGANDDVLFPVPLISHRCGLSTRG